MDSSEPKEGEPELLSPAVRRSQKPQTLAWTTPNSGDNDDIASNASTPSEDYNTPSTENAPPFTFHNPSPKRHASPAKSSLSDNRGTPADGSDNNSGKTAAGQSGVQLGAQSGEQRRSGGQSYVLQDWPDATAELAPGIPMPSSSVSRTASSSSAKSGSSAGSAKSNGRGTTPVGGGSESDANGLDAKASMASNSARSAAASKKPAVSPAAATARPTLQASSDRPTSTSAAQKKTTFAALPNQTTWVKETLQRGAAEKLLSLTAATGGEAVNQTAVRDQTGGNAGAPPALELSDIRAKMEERRRQIESEKRRLEADYARQRQQVGSVHKL